VSRWREGDVDPVRREPAGAGKEDLDKTFAGIMPSLQSILVAGLVLLWQKGVRPAANRMPGAVVTRRNHNAQTRA
jgi:hypothetical protein